MDPSALRLKKLANHLQPTVDSISTELTSATTLSDDDVVIVRYTNNNFYELN